jgi:multiple antibiotic resistance protein
VCPLPPSNRAVLDLFLSAFVTLFVVIDPPGCAPIFAGLTSGAPPRQANIMALRACFIALLILIAFALFGEQLLGALHIELNSFRLAGGIMLFLIALEMVFEKRTQRNEERVEKILATPEIEDVSVFPLAIPMIAGPGSIATIMLLMSRAEGTQQTLIVIAALASVMLLLLLALLAAGPIMRLLGSQVEAVITRLLGVLLAALAAQYVIDGVRKVLTGA